MQKDIHKITQKFPPEEKYSLTDQIRRSFRSVCVNLAEVCKKRKYKPHFISKLSDRETENNETCVWLNFSVDFNYIFKEIFDDYSFRNNEAEKILCYIINNTGKFL